MNVINQPNQEIIERLGGIQILVPGKNYRLNKYVVEERVDDRVVLYNGFNRALIDMNEEEYNNCISITRDLDYVDFFFRNYFVVPDDYDERAEIEKVMEGKRSQIDENYLKNTNLYTILPTTGCNARCFYCYELGTKTKVMTKETAEKIATLIVRRYKEKIRQNPDNRDKVKLHWFGGEPTLGANIIDHICEILVANNVPFIGDIISNGYLFNPELSKKARELWKIDNAQITIDGTEEVYNKTKAYVYKDDPNPFKTVIGNIRNLISNGIRVAIRINVDLYNAEDVKNLIPQIKSEFGPENLLSMYAYPIFEGHGIKRTPEHLKQTIDKIEEIDQVLEDYGYSSGTIGGGLSSHHCMADGGNALLFSPDGNIGLCEHYVDKEFIGHIDDPDNLNMEIVKKFWEREEDLEICSSCPDYLDCIRLSMCEDLRVCNEEIRRWRTNQVRRKVRNTVKRYYEEIRNKENNRCQNSSVEGDLAEIKESLRILHNKIDTIFRYLNNQGQ
jgi:radical SAM protein with 4Fe4S-binding SPASM domain